MHQSCLLYFSPIGEVFRARLRQFPSLVNCCTIDWFSEWPEEALQSVASTFLHEITDLDEGTPMQGLVGRLYVDVMCSVHLASLPLLYIFLYFYFTLV